MNSKVTKKKINKNSNIIEKTDYHLYCGNNTAPFFQ